MWSAKLSQTIMSSISPYLEHSSKTSIKNSSNCKNQRQTQYISKHARTCEESTNPAGSRFLSSSSSPSSPSGEQEHQQGAYLHLHAPFSRQWSRGLSLVPIHDPWDFHTNV
eukprot:gb/GECG01013969.1/.p1 GENE.gb/GECG01013969.1/~~gb/GECG01013969.1/.p1  ORF type:complete len:111 (+),score=3.65 gb/GECG01013969.1/:1-333(+)